MRSVLFWKGDPMKLTKKQWALFVYIPLFYLAWAGVEMGLVPVFEQDLGKDSTALFLLKEGLLKILIWVIPAMLLLRRFDGEVHIPLKEMFNLRFNWLHFSVLLGIVCAFFLVSHLVHEHTLHFHMTWRLLGFILVGITEEIAFRGWLLNAMYTDRTQKYMMEVNALMFLCIHCPIWIHEGMFVQAFTGLGFLSILAMGMIFAWSFVHFRSLWVPVILHVAYDVLLTAMNP